MSKPFTEAAGLPVSEATPVTSYTPMVLPVPGRPVDLRIKVSAPVTGADLPVILLSHGHGPSNFVSSFRGYGPVADFWAAHGFVVVQPTHLDSMTLGLREADHPEAPLYWRSRAQDMHHILDHLGEIEATVPGLEGRLDPERVAAVGHSMGGHTVGLLCGQSAADPADGTPADLSDDRVRAGVLLAAPGRGTDLAAFASEHYPILASTDFDSMTRQALIVVGDHDVNPALSDRKNWNVDAYLRSPGPKDLLTLYGAEHGLGGVAGYDAAETTDENPERVAALRAMVWAYLRTALYSGDPAWREATATLAGMPDPVGTVETKPLAPAGAV